MKYSHLIVPIVLTFAVVSAAFPAPAEGDDDAQIAETIESFVTALNTADVEALVATFTEDATAFLPLLDHPTRVGGHQGLRNVFGPFFDRLRQRVSGPMYMSLVPYELKIQHGGDLAVATFHLTPVPENALEKPLSFGRRTLVLVHTDLGWKILHLHASQVVVPAGTTVE